MKEEKKLKDKNIGEHYKFRSKKFNQSCQLIITNICMSYKTLNYGYQIDVIWENVWLEKSWTRLVILLKIQIYFNMCMRQTKNIAERKTFKSNNIKAGLPTS